MSRFSHEYPENYESVLEDYMEEADRRRRERIIEGMIAFPPTASGKVDAILEAYIALRRAEKASPHSDTTPEPEKP